MSEWRRFDNRAALDAALADALAAALAEDLARAGAASLALSGGSTPKGMFEALSGRALDWAKVAITLVDERWVAPDHPDSNERLLRQHLLRGPAAAARLVGLKTPATDPRRAEAEVAARIAGLPRPFSAVVLGMGGDGHTASWFPQAANLAALLDPAGTALVAATEPVTAAHPRMTLTLPAVLDSRGIALHCTGEDKREVLEDACAAGHPVAAVLTQTITPVTIWWAP